jgi:hypothetical protein
MTGRADSRITRVGRLLRVTRLDELPQLWNVLTGDMSLVGPRPEVQAVVDRYNAEQRLVLEVKPGLTGPTQLAWLDESDRYPPDVDVFEYYLTHIMPRKVESDLAYVRSRSLAADFGYLLKTPLTLGGAALGLVWGSPLRSKMGRLAVDCLAVAVANGLALAIWLEALGPSDPVVVHGALRGLVAGCLVYMLSFLVFQAYRSIWRYASDLDLPRIVGACVFGGLLHAAALRLAGWSYPRSVLVLTVLLTVLLMGGVRLLARGRVAMRASTADLGSLLATLALVLVGVKTLVFVFGSGARSPLVIAAAGAVLVAIALMCRTIGHRWLAARRRQPDGRRRRVLIAGVGDTAPRLVRAMAVGAVGEFQPVGFLDDDASNRGGTIAGLQVLGRVATSSSGAAPPVSSTGCFRPSTGCSPAPRCPPISRRSAARRAGRGGSPRRARATVTAPPVRARARLVTRSMVTAATRRPDPGCAWPGLSRRTGSCSSPVARVTSAPTSSASSSSEGTG